MQSTLQDSDKESQVDASGLYRASTTGLELRGGGRLLKESVELLSSMRFAISALSVVGIASAIGTIVPQNSPPINYVNQFGAFWAEVFTWFDVFRVYNAPWFLIVMVLMLTSTSLCLIRNTPRMLKDMRVWREKVRDAGFNAFPYRQQFQLDRPDQAEAKIQEIANALTQQGYRTRTYDAQAGLPRLVAKKGASNRLGYIAAHLAIVVISLGGLLDSEVPTKMAVWWWNKAPVVLANLTGDQVPDSARLPQSTPTYRANLLIPEGQRSDLAVINQPKGALLVDLPFELELKQFRIEYYNTGMPKLFASDVVLTDKETGQTKSAVIEVNRPLIHKGIAIYQSSFDDGGSKLKLLAHPLSGPVQKPLPIELGVGQALALKNATQTLNLEISGFKAINVENLAGNGTGPQEADAFQKNVASVLSPAANAGKTKSLTNVGAAFQYKLRDAAGQAREFHVYMLPVELEGSRVFLAGVRNSPDESFRYLRIPADEKDSLDTFLHLRAAMDNPGIRAKAAQAFALSAAPPAMQKALADSAQKALDALASNGLVGLANILEQTVQASERERAADVVVRMLTGAFWEVLQQSRVSRGLPRQPLNEANQSFAQRALNAYSDAKLFDAPLLITMADFTEVKASVFQVTRSPGKTTVYLGCLLLTLGVFAMLYVRERRFWIWIKQPSDASGQTSVLMAASTPRHSLDFDREFEELTQRLSRAH
ncbi:MAG: cytochrome c biogenesis protein ResB [Burkholderiaceae bacterium]